MFKSIEYKLILYILCLIALVAGGTYLFTQNQYVWGALAVVATLFALRKLHTHYRKFNKNILFLLNALDNADYSFGFAETNVSSSEKEVNAILNRIKDILTKARKEVIENETFLSIILESVSTGIVILDDHNNVQRVNQAALKLLGLPVFTHLSQLNAVDDTFAHVFRNLQPAHTVQIKVVNEREEMQISLHLSTITMKKGTMKIVTLSNIGNELEAKEMESWIRLIRVMTHEIMNSIAPITSLTDTLLFAYNVRQNKEVDQALCTDTVDALHTISTTAKGLITFVDSYRKFTGVPKPQCCDFDLNMLIQNSINLESSHLKGENIDFQFEPTTNPCLLHADQSQVTQVLVNLIKNAIEAITPTQSGIIRIRTKEVDGRLRIDVMNNGQTIPNEVAAHIFIPFFTTKATGTGIGLSISRYIMRLHGGNLKLHTADGWTIFSMGF